MKKILSTMCVAAAVAFGAVAAHAQNSGGTLSFLVQPEPPTLASYVSTSGPIGLVMPKVYEGLFDYANDGSMVPILAESYDMSADGKTVTFNLRKGVKWHDGRPFAAADVVFTHCAQADSWTVPADGQPGTIQLAAAGDDGDISRSCWTLDSAPRRFAFVSASPCDPSARQSWLYPHTNVSGVATLSFAGAAPAGQHQPSRAWCAAQPPIARPHRHRARRRSARGRAVPVSRTCIVQGWGSVVPCSLVGTTSNLHISVSVGQLQVC